MDDKKKTNVTRVTAKTQAYDEKQARTIVGVIAAVVILFVFIIIASVNSGGGTTSDEATEAVGTSESRPDEAKSTDLAKRVEENFLAGWGVSSFSELRNDPDVPADSHSIYITGFEDVSSGTVRVFVQKDITRDEATEIGRQVMTMTGFEIEDLSTVVVRGTDGLDVNFFRSEIPGFRQALG